MKSIRQNQVLEKTNIACLYRSSASGLFYGIFTRGQRQAKRSLKTSDKELTCRRLEDLRQKVARLNTKEGRTAKHQWASTDSSQVKSGSSTTERSGQMPPKRS